MSALIMFMTTFAVSLDGFGVGIMYGMRKIRIPFLSIFIISLCSGIVVFSAMHIGVIMLQFMSATVASRIGAFILIAIGLWAMGQFLLQRGHDHREESVLVQDLVQESKTSSIKFEIKSLGLVIHILRTPSRADVDRSGNISATEATLLGLALSLDAFGAGIGIGLIGFSPILTSLAIAIASGVFIFGGLRLGYVFAKVNWIRKLSVLPGFMLIIIGIIKLL